MYRILNDIEISSLKKQACSADDWALISVKENFITDSVSNTHFVGKVKLGVFSEKIVVEKGINKKPGIRNSYIENCTIGDNVLISNVNSLINYDIEDNVAIENVGTIVVNGETAFGNKTEIEVLNEGGGRELPIFDRLSAQIAYLLVVYRHDKVFTENLEQLIRKYVDKKVSSRGSVGVHARILNTISVRNVNVGSFSIISGASNLEEGTIVSSKEAPAKIGEDVIAKNFIIQSGSLVDGGAIITSSFIGQGVIIGKQFSSENSAFFANCEGFHGEACSLFAGPYTVTHHKSTLLIAGMFSFYNAGSGTNQSNHMYKLGPVHQGIVERGTKTGSFSYMLWPCRVGVFSVVMDKHGANFDTTELPFSYINVINGKSVITPAMNLFTVGTVRDSGKWPKRDRRKDPEKLDLINFDFFSPYIVGKIVRGSELLSELHESTPKTKEFATHKGAHINRLMLRTSRRYYDLAIDVYMGNEIIKRLEKFDKIKSLDEVREILKPEASSKKSNWLDLLGLFAPENLISDLMDSVKTKKILSVDELQGALRQIHEAYEKEAYAWCVNLIEDRLGIKPGKISAEQLTKIIIDWKTNSIKLKTMVLKDAEKEFDQHSKIGFGIDGDEKTQIDDFEAIRGTYDNNSFVQSIRQEMDDIKEKEIYLCTDLLPKEISSIYRDMKKDSTI